jgi:hypothetical protein
MTGALCVVLVLSIADVIIQATRLQEDKDDGRARLSMLAQLAEVCIIGSMLIYYLKNIYPILLGR